MWFIKMNKNLILGIIIGIILVVAIYSLVKTPFKSSKLSGLEFIVYKTPTCGCCKEYIGYLKMNGANVKVNEISDEELTKIKNQLGVPQALWSCHTALITQTNSDYTQTNADNIKSQSNADYTHLPAGRQGLNADNNVNLYSDNKTLRRSAYSPRKFAYFIEGHIPIEVIQKLLTEKPDIDGIALPGMPSGSPGMPGFKIYPFKIHSVKNGEDKGIFMEI
ncbi:MAG: hypothetical protein KatS3mg095_0472 [Candidatus Parcubacteria bacterium]|nr:MAG: hypothetical protein KatS3mg095_0472 [Candidatus Parcubacteria bacterium]